MKKRGLSAIITTILLISLVIVIVGVIYLWMKTTNTKLMGEGTQEKTCSELQFDVGDFCYETSSVLKEQQGGTIVTLPDPTATYNLRFNVRSNQENQAITGFLISMNDNNGNIKISGTSSQTAITGIEARTFFSDELQSISDFKQIKVTPKIELNSKEVFCDNKEISAGEVKPCN